MSKKRMRGYKITMKNKLLLILIIGIVLSSVGYGQSGGGGGSYIVSCNDDYYKDAINDTIGRYNDAIKELEYKKERTLEIGKQLEKRANILEFIIAVLILYLIITLGMNLQQIKDKGFRKWWKKE